MHYGGSYHDNGAADGELGRSDPVDPYGYDGFLVAALNRRHFESWFHHQQAIPGKIHEMEFCHGMLACVVGSAGIALMPLSMLESMPGSHQASAWPLPPDWRYLKTWLVWRRGKNSPA